jgi:Zinc carboxypeptidase
VRAFGIPLLIMLGVAVSAAAGGPPDLRTRAERTRFEETSRSEDVQAVLAGLAATAGGLVHVTSFGRSEEARDLPLAVLGSPAPRDPAAALASSRPRVLVLANIHAGEVEGKEAALILARRLAGGDLRRLLDRVTVLVAPVYNVDGNDRIDPRHRSSQFGPIGGVGTRENARGLDLNRDFIKLESAEARGLAALLAAWDPHAVIDLHSTDGSYHGYHLTYAPTLAVNADPRLVQASLGLLTAARDVLRDRGWRTHSYGNFVAEGALDREHHRPEDAGGAPAWRTFDARPRFVTNGVGLRNRIAVLSEAYSYLSFERRVRVTETFVETLLALIARRAPSIVALTATLDRETADAGGRGALGALGTRGRLVPLEGAVRILVGDVETRPNPRTGAPMTVMRESVARPLLMQDYASFAPIDRAPAPLAYLIPGDAAHAPLAARVAELLARHGIAVERLDADRRLTVEAVTAGDVTRTPRGRRVEVRLAEVTRGRHVVVAPAGSLQVPMGQPLARLIFHLLEPSSDDGVVTWDLAGEWVRAGEAIPIFGVVE